MKDRTIGTMHSTKHSSKRNALTILSFVFVMSHLCSQTILVQPYLQSATPSSMTIKWETNTNTETVIKYGLTQDLGTGSTGTAMTTLGSTILHKVTLND